MSEVARTPAAATAAVPGHSKRDRLPSRSGQDRVRVRLLPYADDHREGVYRLYAEVFGPEAARAYQARWRWSQEQNLHPQRTPRWVLLDGNTVVGFLATVPMLYSVAGETVMGHTPCDYMVHPDYRFHGIKLMQEFFRACENCVSCDDIPATIKVTEWLGAKRVGMLVRHIRILDARALGMRPRWDKVPSWTWWPVTRALRARDAVRRLGSTSGASVRPLEVFDQRFERLSHEVARQVPVTVVRDLRFFQWRYGGASPQADREIGVVTGDTQELVGYVVFSLPQGPGPTGQVLDLQTLPPGDARTAAALLGYAVDRLRRKGAWAVRYNHLASRFAVPVDVLKRCGFIARGGPQLLVKFQDPRWMTSAMQQQNWSYSFGDSEASHASK